MPEFDSSTVPQNADKEGISLRRINRLLQDYVFRGAKGATQAQATVGEAVSTIVGSGQVARRVAIYNNSATGAVWIGIGAAVPPVADTGTLLEPVGDGLGILLRPGAYWESPEQFKEPVKAIGSEAGIKLTVTTFSR